jgi:choline dehydrogenase
MPEIVGNWLPSMIAAGVDASTDPYSGDNVGAFFATSMINPSNWTRSYSRSAYLDPIIGRSNLQLVVNATVSKIVLDQSGAFAKAIAVEYMTEEGGQVQTIKINKEIIIAGGSVGSPQILQLSGVGPKATVEAVGISSTIDLPGVGQHVKDHLVGFGSDLLAWKLLLTCG